VIMVEALVLFDGADDIVTNSYPQATN
jgi:hypothetical protein